MAMLSSRLEKLEDKLPKEKKPGRVIRLVANDEDEAEARRMLEAEGFDPESGDIAIIRLIVPAPGQKLPPRVPSITIKAQHESRVVPEPKRTDGKTSPADEERPARPTSWMAR